MIRDIRNTMARWTGVAPADFRDTAIRPIPCERARFVVTIDGAPYAGFHNRFAAEEAVRLWAGEVTGGGLPISAVDRATCGWPAARGHILAVVER